MKKLLTYGWPACAVGGLKTGIIMPGGSQVNTILRLRYSHQSFQRAIRVLPAGSANISENIFIIITTYASQAALIITYSAQALYLSSKARLSFSVGFSAGWAVAPVLLSTNSECVVSRTCKNVFAGSLPARFFAEWQ